MDAAWRILWNVSLGVLGVLMVLCVIRLVRGPRVADRIVGVNMLTTLVCVSVGVLALMLKEGYLADAALILCMLGFLAVVLLCKIYIGAWSKKQAEKNAGEEGGR